MKMKIWDFLKQLYSTKRNKNLKMVKMKISTMQNRSCTVCGTGSEGIAGQLRSKFNYILETKYLNSHNDLHSRATGLIFILVCSEEIIQRTCNKLLFIFWCLASYGSRIISKTWISFWAAGRGRWALGGGRFVHLHISTFQADRVR